MLSSDVIQSQEDLTGLSNYFFLAVNKPEQTNPYPKKSWLVTQGRGLKLVL